MSCFHFKFGLLPKCRICFLFGILYILAGLELLPLNSFLVWLLGLHFISTKLHSTSLSHHKFLHPFALVENCISLRIPLSSDKIIGVAKSGSQNQSWVSVWVVFKIALNQIGKNYSLLFSFHSSLNIHNCILFSLSD